MKKKIAVAALLGLSLPVMAQAIEFQAPGALGMGRAGVARTTDAYAAFINPAGLAFHEKAFSSKLNAALGLRISSSLADNVDKISKLDTDKLSYTETGNAVTDAAAAAASTAQAVQALAIVDSIDKNDGSLSVNVDVALAFQFRNYALGIGGTSELGGRVGYVDRVNLRTGEETATGTALGNVQELVTDLNNGTLPTGTIANQQTYFSASQWADVKAKIMAATGASDAEAAVLANKVGEELSKPDTSVAGLTSDQVVSGFDLAAKSFTGGSIDDNKTVINLTGLVLAEVPVSYGHKFDLGAMGKLGIGGSLKVMQGTVYYQEALLFQDFKDGSSDFTKRVKDNKADSTTFGVDLGAMWRLEDVTYIGPINVGLVAKNLNSPEFDGPKNPTTGAATSKVKVKPQARLGVALDPYSWLSLVADMDLTKNKTVLPGRDSQLIGGGLEAHFEDWYALWLALRAGVYKNIGQGGSKPVITAGFSLGPKWLRLDVNGAFATEKGVYDNKSYPNEAKVEFALSTAFY